MFDILKYALQNQMENHPKFNLPETTQEKFKNLIKHIKDSMEDITVDLKDEIKKNKINDLSKLTLKSAKRTLSNDGLSGFLPFDDELVLIIIFFN